MSKSRPVEEVIVDGVNYDGKQERCQDTQGRESRHSQSRWSRANALKGFLGFGIKAAQSFGEITFTMQQGQANDQVVEDGHVFPG